MSCHTSPRAGMRDDKHVVGIMFIQYVNGNRRDEWWWMNYDGDQMFHSSGFFFFID